MSDRILNLVDKDAKETILNDFNRLAEFDEEACNLIFEFSNDRLQRMMAVEIARLNGYLLGAWPPDDKERA